MVARWFDISNVKLYVELGEREGDCSSGQTLQVEGVNTYSLGFRVRAWTGLAVGTCDVKWERRVRPDAGSPENLAERLKFDVTDTPNNAKISILYWKNYGSCILSHS